MSKKGKRRTGEQARTREAPTKVADVAGKK